VEKYSLETNFFGNKQKVDQSTLRYQFFGWASLDNEPNIPLALFSFDLFKTNSIS
jgi:hypothetical protein